MEFKCTACGKMHEALPPEEAPEQDPAKLAELKAAWDKTYARAEQATGKTKEELEKLWASVDRASMAYLSARRYTGVPRIPDTLVSVKGPDGYVLKCAEPCLVRV